MNIENTNKYNTDMIQISGINKLSKGVNLKFIHFSPRLSKDMTLLPLLYNITDRTYE